MPAARARTGGVADARTSDRKSDGGSTRHLLLQASSELMIEMGTYDVSLHAIARKAGVTAPLITYHFGGKDDLLIALAERDTSRAQAQLEKLAASDLDPALKLRIHIAGIFRTFASFPYLNGLLDNLQVDDTSEKAVKIRDSFVVPLIKAQGRIIQEGIDAGVFRPVDPAMAYFLIVGTCHYICSTRVAASHLLKSDRNDERFAREYAAKAIDIIFNGLAAQ